MLLVKQRSARDLCKYVDLSSESKSVSKSSDESLKREITLGEVILSNEGYAYCLRVLDLGLGTVPSLKLFFALRGTVFR